MSDRRYSGQPDRRLIVLGASNVTRGLRAFCQSAAVAWGRPLEVLAAIGHGRSYGATSSVLGRTLPSIRSCELWEECRAREPRVSAGFLTDVGNDIMYGFAPEQIAEWVRECAERLQDQCQRVVVTGLPLASVARLGPRRYGILRRILFPSSRLTQSQALDRARELHERVEELARTLQLEWTCPEPGWFGIDPIHIRRRYWSVAWAQLLQPLRGQQDPEIVPTNGTVWKLRRLRAKHRWMFGVELRQDQPVWVGPDGSSLSIY